MIKKKTVGSSDGVRVLNHSDPIPVIEKFLRRLSTPVIGNFLRRLLTLSKPVTGNFLRRLLRGGERISGSAGGSARGACCRAAGSKFLAQPAGHPASTGQHRATKPPARPPRGWAQAKAAARAITHSQAGRGRPPRGERVASGTAVRASRPDSTNIRETK